MIALAARATARSLVADSPRVGMPLIQHQKRAAAEGARGRAVREAAARFREARTQDHLRRRGSRADATLRAEGG